MVRMISEADRVEFDPVKMENGASNSNRVFFFLFAKLLSGHFCPTINDVANI